MQLSDFRCHARLRVRWAEVDMQRIVFNAHYLMYIDTAMTEYWRALALPYETSMEQLGGELYLKKVTLEYHASAREGDSLTVGLRRVRVGTSSCQFLAGIFCNGQLLVSGELIYVFANPVTQRPVPVPAALRTLFDAYEAGEVITQLVVDDWERLGDVAQPLRHSVFVQEQGVPADLEQDANDTSAVHALITNRLGQAIATGRLVQQSPGVSKIGRMAVHRALRSDSYGRQVLDALLGAAQARGDRQVVLNAQASAQTFYERAGFIVCGERFDEAGLPHVPMQRGLE